MVIQRGDIWWADLTAPRRSEPGYRRPVLIISADAFNRSRINTVVVVVITSNTALAQSVGNVPLTKRDSGLPKRSVVNVSQVMSIDKSFLVEKVRRLSATKLAKVEAGMRLVLGFS